MITEYICDFCKKKFKATDKRLVLMDDKIICIDCYTKCFLVDEENVE